MARARRGEIGYKALRRFAGEGKAEADAVLARIAAEGPLAAADFDPLIALLRQIEAHAAVPEALRDQAAAVLREYAAGRRASVRKAKTLRHQTSAPGTNL